MPAEKMTGTTNQRPSAFLFDLDGILLDTEPLHGRAWFETALQFGAKISKAQLIELRGRRRHDCAAQIDNWLPKPVGTEALLEVQQPIARSLLSLAQAIPGAENLVRMCHQLTIPIAIVTSSSSEAVSFKCERHPWLKLIRTRVQGDDPDLHAGKPDPAPFLLAANRLGVCPTKCWALEDSIAGTQSALSAGCMVWILDHEIDKIEITGNPLRISSLATVSNNLINTIC